MGSKQKPTKKSYTALEVAELIKKLPETRIGHSTGISAQEILGIQKEDINKDGSAINIQRAKKIKKSGGMYIGDVKAEMRERVAIVPPAARASAVFLRENAKGYILAGDKDMPLHPSTYRKFFKSAVVKTEVRYLTPHCCRHTYISHLEDLHTDFAVIQALAGQSTKASTIRYIHPQSKAIADAVSNIDTLLSGPPDGPPSTSGKASWCSSP